ncbi:MAG: CDP-glucose 4,6-dehydratase [Erysipelotrichaceae bacterium]
MSSFYQGKKVLITGHTGFKGSWLCKILIGMKADVYGFALAPNTVPNLFELSSIEAKMHSIIGDIRDLKALDKAFELSQPEIVIHLAAQALVRESYEDPRSTYEINVMGTVNLFECIRKYDCVKSVLNVTTDKVYQNNDREYAYLETDPLDGFDPYSNSKSCSELVTHSYQKAFFAQRDIAISTARAGNVIGGGDFAKDRIIPDCFRAISAKTAIIIRNPYSIRPYQHVLEPLFAYLMIIERQYNDHALAGYYNVGPDDQDCISTGSLVDSFCLKWLALSAYKATWIDQHDGGPHEAKFLKLDCSKLKSTFNWQPVWGIDDALSHTVRWYVAYQNKEDVSALMDQQISEFRK